MATRREYPVDKIDAVIRKVAAENNALVTRNLLLDLDALTADYSYVIVDRYGMLVVDVEMWPGASIRGDSRGKWWTARYQGAPRKRFPNPLSANNRRVAALKDALLVFGRRFPPEYYADLVVAYGVDVLGVKVNEADQLRVVYATALEEALRARYDFAVNPGGLEPHEIEGVASLLKTLDRSDRSDVRARHEQQEALARRTWAFWRKPRIEVAVGDAALGIAPMAPHRAAGRYPDLPAPKPRKTGAAALLVVLIAVALGVWLFVYDGYAWVQTGVQDALGTAPPATTPSTRAEPAFRSTDADLEKAQAILKESAPDIYDRISNLNDVRITTQEGYRVYTWSYIGPDVVRHTISLTLDSSGQLRGVSGS